MEPPLGTPRAPRLYPLAQSGHKRDCRQRTKLPTYRIRIQVKILVLGIRIHRRHTKDRKSVEQSTLSAAHNPQRQPLVHHPERIIRPDERNGILQRRIRLVGPHILHERINIQSTTTDKKIQLARSSRLPRNVRQPQRQKPPRQRKHRHTIQIPIRR